MSAYLFLWNPSTDPEAFKDYAAVCAKAARGQAYETFWRCPSLQPQPGDAAFMQRTGPRDNGLFAVGTVTKATHFNSRGHRGVRLKLSAFLPIGSEIPREDIVKRARWRKPWRPMASGTVILDPLLRAINALWKASATQERETELSEGGARQVTLTKYERSATARQKCIEHHGCRCSVCGLDFACVYGAHGQGFIHVHHLTQLSEAGRSSVDPIADLRPVCPNCHAMLHRKRNAMSIEQLRQLVRAQARRHK